MTWRSDAWSSLPDWGSSQCLMVRVQAVHAPAQDAQVVRRAHAAEGAGGGRVRGPAPALPIFLRRRAAAARPRRAAGRGRVRQRHLPRALPGRLHVCLRNLLPCPLQHMHEASSGDGGSPLAVFAGGTGDQSLHRRPAMRHCHCNTRVGDRLSWADLLSRKATCTTMPKLASFRCRVRRSCWQRRSRARARGSWRG